MFDVSLAGGVLITGDVNSLVKSSPRLISLGIVRQACLSDCALNTQARVFYDA